MRNNKNRLGAQQEDSVAATGQIAPGLTFVVPTEFIELPSQGKLYPPDHQLHNQKTIEIKQMTAKEEDILTSESLIRNGVVLHRLIESVVVDDNIDPMSMLTCDRNAIVIWSRIYGYGSEYNTKFQCPSCGNVEELSFDLKTILESKNTEELDYDNAEFSESGNFIVTLPTTGWKVECRMANGYSEKQMAAQQNSKTKDSLATSQMKMIIKSIEGHQDKKIINQAIEVMPAKDALHLRFEYQNLYPELELEHAFSCKKCGFSQEVEVPITADFFWIKQ